jgi:hypothetical protein
MMEDEFIPIRKAAKLVHKSRSLVRKLVDQRLVAAQKIGETKNSPWLAVHMGQLREALAREQAYVPAASQKSHRRSYRKISSELHPSAASI